MTGIYYWKNKITNKYYIGQSIDINKRLTQHKWAYQQQNQKYPLYIEMRNYGIENFEWGILEECSIDEVEQNKINSNVLYESEYKEKISKSAFRKVVRYDTWKNIKY